MIRTAQRLAVLALVAMPGIGWSQGVTVTSGEHDGFTRLVVDFGQPVDWQMGRTSDGYGLRMAGSKPSYDLSAAFQVIGKDRISALWVDKVTGDLNLGIGCACYAMPFAFRPSIVVIDVKPGKPPQASAFEAPLTPASGQKTTALPDPPATSSPAADIGPSYDWVGARLSGLAPDSVAKPANPSAPLPVAQKLEPLRKALIEEMSRGAAAGLIDLSLPRNATEGMVVGVPSVQVTQGDSPNYATHLGENPQIATTSTGTTCLPDTALDIVNWAISDKPVAEQMALPMSGLVGEFDKPDAEGLARAVKFDLYLGFGAEARALLRAFPTGTPEAVAWESIGLILDDRIDTTGTFQTQSGCDTAAAMWAALSIADLAHEPAVNAKAIVRAFSALPPHLRLLLGPKLADKLLAIHDALAARSVRDAMTRLPGEKAADVTLLEAKLDVAQGDLSAAEARLAPLAAQSGPASENALAELVIATASDLKPIAVEQIDALAAVAQERRDGPDQARFAAAVTLGRAAAGQFDQAFVRLGPQPELTAKVWELLSVLGTDDDLVTYAVLAPGTAPSAAAAPAAAQIADRLLGLGFAEQAAAWSALDATPDPNLVARLALAQDDAAAALSAVAGSKVPADLDLKAQSLNLSGNHRAAADIYQTLGNQPAYWAAEGLAQDWHTLAKDGTGPWSDAAQALLATPAAPAPAKGQPSPGPLAHAQAIVSASDTTMTTISALLNTVPSPAPPTQ